MTEAVLSSRVIAEHPPVELLDRRDDHTRVWEIVREVETTHPDGSTTVDTVKSYIHEKGSGLCYKDASGDYVPSVAEWRETPDGFVIDRCWYGLSIGKAIGSGVGYSIGGHELVLSPAYLMISDGLNEEHLAVLNAKAEGFIVPGCPSVLRFPAGGIYVESAADELTVEHCAIVNNQAIEGGGIYAVNSNLRIEGCLIAANLAQSYGGGGLKCLHSQITVERSQISGNVGPDSDYGGGGIYWSGDTIGKVVSCSFTNNRAYDGPALLIDIDGQVYTEAQSTVLNCTMADNVIIWAGYAATIWNMFPSHQPQIINTILWDNVEGGQQRDLGQCSASYSDVEAPDGGYPGSNNMQVDPEFFGTAYGYHHIQHYEAGPPLPRSPCVDAGDPTDPGLGSNIDGEPRKLPGGTGQNRVDMGCDEAHPFKASLRISKSTPGPGGSFSVTLTWNSEQGVSYEVYSSVAERTYSDRMGWEAPITWPGQAGQTSWEDTVPYDDTDTQRYYKVKAVNGTYAGTFSDPVGFVNVPVKSGATNQYTLISVPLQTRSEKVNEGLGAMIAERLTGSSSSGIAHQLLLGHWDDENRVFVEKTLWLRTDKQWVDMQGTPADDLVERGDAPTLLIRSWQQSPPPVITFLGYVPMDTALFARIRENAVGQLQAPWGMSYPVETTLNDIPFVAFGAVGKPLAQKASADRMLVDRTGESTWKTLWLRDDGTWMDWDTDTPASISLIEVLPGKGFHYKMGQGITTVYIETRYFVLRRPYGTE